MKKSLKPIKIQAKAFLCVTHKDKSSPVLHEALVTGCPCTACEQDDQKKDKLKGDLNFPAVIIKCYIHVV